MKLIYSQGFSKNEKLEWKPVVFNNIVQSFRLIFDAMQELEIEFQYKENEVSFPRGSDGASGVRAAAAVWAWNLVPPRGSEG